MQYCEHRWKHFPDAATQYLDINTFIVSYFCRYIPELQQNFILRITAEERLKA